MPCLNNILVLFCEDIRQEKDSIVSLVGILPDNINLVGIKPGQPMTAESGRMLSKLCMYLRMNFDPRSDFSEAQMRATFPDGEVVSLGSMAPETVAKAKREALEKGNPLAGVISQIILGGVKPATGSLKIEVVAGDEVYLAGALNFTLAEETTVTSTIAGQQTS